jgi:nitrogen regulatory protein PII
MKKIEAIIQPFKLEEVKEALKGIELSARFKTRLQSLIGKPEGKPTLVSEDDKRPALDYSTAQGLENLDVI